MSDKLQEIADQRRVDVENAKVQCSEVELKNKIQAIESELGSPISIRDRIHLVRDCCCNETSFKCEILTLFRNETFLQLRRNLSVQVQARVILLSIKRLKVQDV